jgi:uncharacterized membrane protein YccC
MIIHPLLRLPKDLLGIHYALRILIGTTIVWFVFQKLGDRNPLWAIISLILVTEPKIQTAWLSFKARIINTLAGCLMGLFFLTFIIQYSWLLPIALTIAVLVASYVIKMPLGWRIAPVTTAIIISAGVLEKSTNAGLEIAAHRTVEVFAGSLIALLITWIMSLIWAPSEAEQIKNNREVQN